MPSGTDDGWDSLTLDNLTIEELNFEIYPTKNYDYAWNEDKTQIYSYLILNLKTRFF
jgi:hypothetical protein